VLLGCEQCCRNPLAAASAGHLQCLQCLQEQQRFLGLDSPERGSAGELRKLQVWDAAVSACKAGQPGVLAWLFASGWPAVVDAHAPWHLRNVVKPDLWDARKEPYLEVILGALEGRADPELSPEMEVCRVYLPELRLCRYAMLNPDPACLQALLNSGCRSEWICLMAALEGRADFWDLAAEHGCPF
jgi:hypothetical protein